MNTETTTLSELSEQLADAVETASQSIVTVDARRRMPGTGIVWPGEGVIVTANHIVERDEELNVILPDGSKVEASLQGRDPESDLAVLTVSGSDLTPATLATEEPRIGNLILALGKPFADSPQATLGVISAFGSQQNRHWHRRRGPGRGRRRGRGRGGSIERLILTDITMYPGFSGGPLVSAAGEIVGLNTSALGRGLATTIPHEYVSSRVETLLKHGRISHGYLGLAMQPVQLPDNVRGQLDTDQEYGVMVVGVEDDSPASQAGMLLGDTILSLGGEHATDVRSLHELLGPESVGTTLTARYIRAGNIHETDIVIGER